MAAPLVLLIVPAVSVTGPIPSALALLMFKVPAVRVTPPPAAELFPLKVNVPPGAFIVVRPSYVLSPVRVVVPVEVTVIELAVARVPVLFAIAPFTVKLPAPPTVRVLLVELRERLMPLLKTKLPPATDCQVGEVTLAMSTPKLNVCVAVELLTIPPVPMVKRPVVPVKV